jgi:hypothetical protein
LHLGNPTVWEHEVNNGIGGDISGLLSAAARRPTVQALVTKCVAEVLEQVPHNAVKIVSFIKLRPASNIIFQVFCEEMGTVYYCLLSQIDIR